MSPLTLLELTFRFDMTHIASLRARHSYSRQKVGHAQNI